MSSVTAYFTAWVLLVLVGIAFLSAALARHRRLREARRRQGERMLDALDRYSEWVAGLRRAASFLGESGEAAEALDEACTIRLAWFPELAGDMAEMLAVHNRLMHFLAAQQALRTQDTEAWLESDHDERFVALWKQHRLAIDTLQERLELLASVSPAAQPHHWPA